MTNAPEITWGDGVGWDSHPGGLPCVLNHEAMLLLLGLLRRRENKKLKNFLKKQTLNASQAQCLSHT